MALSQMQRVQANFVIKQLEGQNKEDRAEFFKMIGARFCLRCGMENATSTANCEGCDTVKVHP